jgi:hypothetical protein
MSQGAENPWIVHRHAGFITGITFSELPPVQGRTTMTILLDSLVNKPLYTRG